MKEKNQMKTNNEEKVKEIKADIKLYSELEALKNSNGGKILIKSLLKDIIAGLENICGSYKTATHIDLITRIADIDNKMTIFRSINLSTKNKTMAREALKEVIQEEE